MDLRVRLRGRHQDVDLHRAHLHQERHQDVDHQNRDELHLDRQDVDRQDRQGDRQDQDVRQGQDVFLGQGDYPDQDVRQGQDGIQMVQQDASLERFVDLEVAEWGDLRQTLDLEVAEWGDHQDVRQAAYQAAYQEEYPLDDLAAALGAVWAAG